jgi:hypothetical protein
MAFLPSQAVDVAERVAASDGLLGAAAALSATYASAAAAAGALQLAPAAGSG